jgi:hypothetical protein
MNVGSWKWNQRQDEFECFNFEFRLLIYFINIPNECHQKQSEMVNKHVDWHGRKELKFDFREVLGFYKN